MAGNVNLWSKTAATNATADPTINWSEGQDPGTVNNSARALMASVANDRDDTRGALTTGGTSTAYTLTTNSGNTAYQDGFKVKAVIHTTNGAAATLNVDSVGAKPIWYTPVSGAVALPASSMGADFHADFEYDASLNSASGAFVVINVSAAGTIDLSGSGVTNTLPVSKGGTGSTSAGSSGYVSQSNGTAMVATAPATAAQYRTATANAQLEAANVWTAAGTVALTDAATVALDLSSGLNFTLTIGGNRTLGNPSNVKVGQTGFIAITQDGTGSRTLAYAGNYKWAGASAGVLTTTAGAVDVLYYQAITSSFILLTLVKGVG